MTAQVQRFPDRELMSRALAEQVAGDIASALAARGHASIAVPGGTTPGPFLLALAERELDWRHVSATLTDERWVPPDHPRANARLLRETLLTGWSAALDFVPLYAEAATPDAAMAAVGRNVTDRLLPLDVCVLGMGADMHVASLFPGGDRLQEALDPACPSPVLPMRAPGAAEARVTLTLPSLLTAAHIYMLIAGPEKLAALETALAAGSALQAPARAVLHSGRPVGVYYAP